MAMTATNHWKLGLFVVLGIATAVAALFWVGARRFHRESIEAVSYFDESVQGLDVGSPVKFRGVLLGSVRDITVAPDHRHVQVTSDIFVDTLSRLGLHVPQRGEQFIDPNLRVQLASAGITGVRFLETEFFDPERYPPPQLPFTPPWNYVPSVPSTLKSIEEAAVEIANRLPPLEDHARDALADLHTTLGSIDRLAVGLHADDGSFNQLLVRLREAATRVETALDDAKVGPTTASVRDTAGAIGQTASGIGDEREELHASLVALREALESARALADALERDPSTLLRGQRADGALPLKTR
jgi:paraquat-inducible protein B